jgi:hypothetical protein
MNFHFIRRGIGYIREKVCIYKDLGFLKHLYR